MKVELVLWPPSYVTGKPSLVLAGPACYLPLRRVSGFTHWGEKLLGFSSVAELVTQFTGFAGQVVLGLIIFALGLYLANLAAQTIQASKAAQARLLALAARVSVLVLAGAMALRQMGLANEIVNLAFGLLLGAIAVAAALAFGLGGREMAGRELQNWLKSPKSDE